jgi:hypothetical protein
LAWAAAITPATRASAARGVEPSAAFGIPTRLASLVICNEASPAPWALMTRAANAA